MQRIFISKSKLFYLLLFVFIFSIFVSSFFEDFLREKDFILLGINFSLILLIFLFFQKKLPRIIFLVILFLFLGIWRFSLSAHNISSEEIGSLNNEKVFVEGIIKNNPEISYKNQQFLLKTEKANQRELSGNLLVYTSLFPALHYGDRLSLECKLKSPEPIEDFSYDKYLAMKNIYSICYYPDLEILNRNKGNIFLSSIYKIKNKFRQSINKNIGEPYSAILGAMILGDKKNISDELQSNFSRSGISHIIAISGMHIGVFIVVLGFILYYFGFNRNFSFYLVLVFLVIYNVLIAFPASSLRASFMGVLVLYAFKIGRLNKIYYSILLAAFTLVLINPNLIHYDIGFIFSFLALLGIVYFYPIFINLLGEPKNKVIKYSQDILIVSVSAQIFILPLIIKNFGILSIISPIVNLFIIWALPPILIGSILAFLFSSIVPSLSFYLYLPVKFLISYILTIVDFSLKIPFSSFQIDNTPFLLFALYYFLIFLFIIRHFFKLNTGLIKNVIQ